MNVGDSQVDAVVGELKRVHFSRKHLFSNFSSLKLYADLNKQTKNRSQDQSGQSVSNVQPRFRAWSRCPVTWKNLGMKTNLDSLVRANFWLTAHKKVHTEIKSLKQPLLWNFSTRIFIISFTFYFRDVVTWTHGMSILQYIWSISRFGHAWPLEKTLTHKLPSVKKNTSYHLEIR